MLLEGEGYHVLTSEQAIGAMQLFVSHPIDEVIPDSEIPGMTVDVFARHMKALKPNVTIPMVSGDGQLSEEQLKIVDGYMLKADLISIFLERVKALLSGAYLSRDEFSTSGLDIRTEIVEAIKPFRVHAKAA